MRTMGGAGMRRAERTVGHHEDAANGDDDRARGPAEELRWGPVTRRRAGTVSRLRQARDPAAATEDAEP